MAEISQKRKEMQDLLLGDTSKLQSSLLEQYRQGYYDRNKEWPSGRASDVINSASLVIANATHAKALQLQQSGELDTLSDEDLAATILAAAHDGLSKDAGMVKSRNLAATFDVDPDLFYTLTGCKDGSVDRSCEPYKAMLAKLNGTAEAPAIDPMPGAGKQQAQPSGTLNPSQVFGSLFTFHEALKQNPQITAVLMTLTPDEITNSDEGQELQIALANKIKQEANEKYGMDVNDDQARTASRIMLTEFTKWGSSRYPNIKKAILEDGRQLSPGEVNQELSVLATNTRVALMHNADALGELGSKEAIDALVGTGDSSGSVGLNVTNIGFITLSNLGDPNVQALAESRARDSLAVTGELDEKAIFAGISSLPAAIKTDDGVQVQITETTKNFLANAAINAKENCYDQGWDSGFFGRAWEALWAFVSCLLSGGGFSGAIKAVTDIFDSENIEYQNRTKFQSAYVNAITNASAAELGYTGDPALLDSYKQYLVTSSTQRMFEAAAGVPHMEDVSIAGSGNVSARTAPPTMPTTAPTTEYYPGISPIPTTADQAGKAASDAWIAASRGDADPAPLYIQRNGDTPLLVTTMSDAAANTGAYQFDPKNHDAIAQAAKNAAAEATKEGKVVIARDINNNNVIDSDELYKIPKSEVAASKTPVEIVPGK